MKKQSRSPTPARLIQDGGDVALERQADGAILHFVRDREGQNPSLGPKMVNRTVDPLDWYLHRGQITAVQYDAGDWLRRLHYQAYGSGYAAVNYAGIHGVANYADNWRVTSRQSYAISTIVAYLRALPPEQAYVVQRVVYFGQYAGDVARLVGRRQRVGIDLLRAGLTALDEYRHRGLPRRRDGQAPD